MIPPAMRVLFCATPIHMGRSFDALAAVVVERLDDDPTRTDTVFVFANAARDKVKLLWRDATGVCVLYKRWDDNEAALPEVGDDAIAVTMDAAALARLLRGTPANPRAQQQPTPKDVARTAKASARKAMTSAADQAR